MTTASEDSQSSHVSTAIAGVSDTSIATAVETRATRKQNNWRNARLRLMTLRTILQLDMWKDIKYGTVSARHARALTTWQKTLLHENVEFAKVTRWTTIEDNAIKWVDKFAKGERTQAFKLDTAMIQMKTKNVQEISIGNGYMICGDNSTATQNNGCVVC